MLVGWGLWGGRVEVETCVGVVMLRVDWLITMFLGGAAAETRSANRNWRARRHFARDPALTTISRLYPCTNVDIKVGRFWVSTAMSFLKIECCHT